MSIQSLQASELAEAVIKKKPLFILDVRNHAEFDEWKIEGEEIQSLNTPYLELIDGVEPIIQDLPRDKPIVVVCAKQGASVFIGNLLVNAGFTNTYYLKEGITSWSEYLYVTVVYRDQKVTVYQLIRMGKGCLSYMVISGNEALVIDPTRMIEVYEAVAEEEGVKITHIVDTHLHADHISGGKALAEKQLADYYLMKSEGAEFDFLPLENYPKITFEQVMIEVLTLKTPGHTPGSISLLLNNLLLFSGDTLFVNGLGRPDLGGKISVWAGDLYETIYSKIAKIADDVIVLPGHYENLELEMSPYGYVGAELGKIRCDNEMMHGKDKQQFVQIVETGAKIATPPNYEKIIAINRGTLKVNDDVEQDLEIGPNRCAFHHTGK